MLFESLPDEIQNRVGDNRLGRVRLESLGLKGALDRLWMQTQLRGNSANLPMLDVEQSANGSDLIFRNHRSPRLMKGVEEATQPPTDLTDYQSKREQGLWQAPRG